MSLLAGISAPRHLWFFWSLFALLSSTKGFAARSDLNKHLSCNQLLTKSGVSFTPVSANVFLYSLDDQYKQISAVLNFSSVRTELDRIKKEVLHPNSELMVTSALSPAHSAEARIGIRDVYLGLANFEVNKGVHQLGVLRIQRDVTTNSVLQVSFSPGIYESQMPGALVFNSPVSANDFLKYFTDQYQEISAALSSSEVIAEIERIKENVLPPSSALNITQMLVSAPSESGQSEVRKVYLKLGYYRVHKGVRDLGVLKVTMIAENQVGNVAFAATRSKKKF